MAPIPTDGAALAIGLPRVVGASPLSLTAERNPLVRELRRAAGAPRSIRLTLAIGSLVAAARVEIAAALLAAQALRAGQDPRRRGSLTGAVAGGRAQYRLILGLSALCPPALVDEWRWTAEQAARLSAQLQLLVGVGPTLPSPLSPCAPAQLPDTESWRRVDRCPNGVGLFLASLASGWPWETALGLFETLLEGWLSPDRRSFVCGAAGTRRRAATWVDGGGRSSSTAPAVAGAALACLSASFPLGGGSITILTLEDGAVMVQGTSQLSPAPELYLKNCRMIRSCRPGRAPFPSKFAPACIRMPCVQEGRASRILPPPPDTGAIVDFRDNWERLVGPLTGEVRAVIQGLLSMPRTSHEARRSFKKNHPSFQDDPRAHEILGAKAAGWLYHGILEFCPPDRPPSFVEPIGAVPKKPDSLRMINDGREGNKDMAAWPVRYTSPKEVAEMLAYGDFAAGSDFDDAYHASKKGGCCGRIRYERVLRVSPAGCAEWGWQTRVGCSPESCSGTCDKARSGISFGELLARFASCHFGEMTAGSPLNALVMQLRRYFATRGPFADQRRVATAAWVDDMLLILKKHLPWILRGPRRRVLYLREEPGPRRGTRGALALAGPAAGLQPEHNQAPTGGSAFRVLRNLLRYDPGPLPAASRQAGQDPGGPLVAPRRRVHHGKGPSGGSRPAPSLLDMPPARPPLYPPALGKDRLREPQNRL